MVSSMRPESVELTHTMTDAKMPMMLDDHLDALGGGMPSMDDDLFGDEVLPMPSRPPSKQLQQRVDEMRSRGCCRSIAYSKHGTIASISPDGTFINLQCSRTNPSDGSWELSEPMPCTIFSRPLQGGPIVHLSWAPTNNPELAVIDAFGRVCLLTFPIHLNKATYSSRKWDADAQDDLQSIVGCYWLPLPMPRSLNVVYGPATRETDKYTYTNTIMQNFGPWHPNPQKSALVCVTESGLLKLFFSQNSNQVQEIHIEMESITSSGDLITHAAICSERGKLLIVVATVSKQLKVMQAEINWGQAQPPQDKQIPPGSLPLRPSMKIEHVTTTTWLQQGSTDSHLDVSMDHISQLELLPPVLDMKTKTVTPAVILVTRLHIPTPQSPFGTEYQSIIDRWDVATGESQQLHSAFEQRGSKTGVGSSPSAMTRLRKRDSIVVNKIMLSMETTLHGKIICIAFSDGTVQYRDRVTMAEIYHEGHQNSVMLLQQAGFHFAEEKPCLQMSFSHNNCAFAQICENGKVKWNSLRCDLAQMGSSKADPFYDAVLAGLTVTLANAAHHNANYDDVLAIARPFVEKHHKVLYDLVSTLVFLLNINVDYSEEAHHDQLVRNVQLQFVMSLLSHCGFKGEFKPRSFNGRFAMLGLNVRNIVILITLASNSPMHPIKEKITPLDEPEVVNALSGCAKWSLDLLSWLTDGLFSLRNDPKFMEILQDNRSFTEMTNYLKAKNDVSLNLLLCSSTRCFLSAICRRLAHLQAIGNKAMQYWDSRSASSASEPLNESQRELHKAYLRLQSRASTTLIKVEEFDKLLTSLSNDIRQTYQTTLASLQQKAAAQHPQHQGQNRPNSAEAAVKKAQAHCELAILLGEQPPPSFQPPIRKFFETDLRNIMASTKRSELFFTDFPLLEVEDDPRRLVAMKIEGRYVDVFRRVELLSVPAASSSKTIATNGHANTSGDSMDTTDGDPSTSPTGHAAWRRCVRCCAVMEDVSATRPGFNFVLAQQRKCSCGGSWAFLP